MNVEGVITGVSVAHQRADLEAIEAAAGDGEAAVRTALLARPGVSEAFVLQTCNRAEAYVVGDDAAIGQAALEPLVETVPRAAVRWFDHEAAMEHLLRVAAGLESLVLGEDEILGQVRDAAARARSADAVGPILDETLTKAVRVGERARTETAINEGVVSLGSAAVRLLTREYGALDGTTALVVGAGDMGTLAARRLAHDVDRLVVANRTRDRAVRLADEVDAHVDTTVIWLDEVADALAAADVVVSATGSEQPVIEPDDLAGTTTFLVDIGQPRDVAPAATDVDGVTLRTLDDLETVVNATERQREAAAGAVEEIIAEELDRLLTQYKRKRADAVIAAMYESAERIKDREVATAVSQFEAASENGELSEEQRAVIESMADALVGQLLGAPTKSLRDAAEEDDWATINTALELFDPELDASPGHDDGPAAAVDATDLPAEFDAADIPAPVRERIPDTVLDGLADD